MLIQMKVYPHCHVTVDTNENDQYQFNVERRAAPQETFSMTIKPTYQRKFLFTF